MAEQTAGKATARGYSYVGSAASNFELDYRRDERLTWLGTILTGSVQVGDPHPGFLYPSKTTNNVTSSGV